MNKQSRHWGTLWPRLQCQTVYVNGVRVMCFFGHWSILSPWLLCKSTLWPWLLCKSILWPWLLCKSILWPWLHSRTVQINGPRSIRKQSSKHYWQWFGADYWHLQAGITGLVDRTVGFMRQVTEADIVKYEQSVSNSRTQRTVWLVLWDRWQRQT